MLVKNGQNESENGILYRHLYMFLVTKGPKHPLSLPLNKFRKIKNYNKY